MMVACPKTEGIRTQSEGKPLRGIQHRSSGSGLVIRVVYLVGLPDGDQRFLYVPFDYAQGDTGNRRPLSVVFPSFLSFYGTY
jgi:hypothetical protein